MIFLHNRKTNNSCKQTYCPYIRNANEFVALVSENMQVKLKEIL